MAGKRNKGELMVFVVHCVESIMARKAKAELPEGVKLLRDKNAQSFYLSSLLEWDALREWGNKYDAIVSIVAGGEKAI